MFLPQRERPSSSLYRAKTKVKLLSTDGIGLPVKRGRKVGNKSAYKLTEPPAKPG
jgi:hypothetical protein